MVGMFGRKAGNPDTRGFWPYFPPAVSPADELKAMKATEERLVWDGTKHVWK